MLIRRVAGLVLIAMAAACGGCGSGKPIHYYTLAFPPAPPLSANAYPVTLLIGHIGAPDILEDEPIVYRVGPNEIGTYAYHHWDEPPVHMLRAMLIRQLRASGKYQSVALLGSASQGGYVLEGRLDDFEEVDTNGVAALVTMEFELLDRRAGKPVWNHTYSRSQPVQSKEVTDVVAALNRNLMQGINEIESGLDAYFSANPPPKP